MRVKRPMEGGVEVVLFECIRHCFSRTKYLEPICTTLQTAPQDSIDQ